MTQENINKSVIESSPFIVVAKSNSGGQDIEIKNLTVKTPGNNGITLIRDVTMTIGKGDRVVFTGESGSGKTTVAKAILNQWDHGSGLVVLPENVKIMAMSQQAYFANTTLRGMMNISPDDQPKFSDAELTKVLRAVGHDRLIQHIPGQQVEILMADILDNAKIVLQRYKSKEISDDDVTVIRNDISAVVPSLVREQFSVVQYVPDQQREEFKVRLANLFGETLGTGVSRDKIDEISEYVVKEIDLSLSIPLYEHLARTVPDAVRNHKSRILSYSHGESSLFSRWIEKRMDKQLRSYMANNDTDDKARVIKINKTQADHVSKLISAAVKAELNAHNESSLALLFNKIRNPSVKKTINVLSWPLRTAFRVATWPVSQLAVLFRASAVARDSVLRTSFFMDRQVLTGEKLTLSGGERQKLMIAMVLLHKPDILILDEITAALDRENAEKLYGQMMDRIPPETTVISIAHNEHIMKYHTHHAHLSNKTITLAPIKPTSGPAGPTL